MKLEIFPDAEQLAARAADLIAQVITEKPQATVLVATGNTPMQTYAELERRVKAGELNCSGVTAVQLDEYLGLPGGDPRSLYGWMERAFVGPLGISKVIRFDSSNGAEGALEPQFACARFDQEVTGAGGLDLAILGLGPNGHLGFNEPPSGPDAPTRALTLTPESLSSNAAYWGELEVPSRALTAGMSTILSSRRVLLLVLGEHKREVLARALRGLLTPDLPASYLRDTNLTVLADQAAARGLT